MMLFVKSANNVTKRIQRANIMARIGRKRGKKSIRNGIDKKVILPIRKLIHVAFGVKKITNIILSTTNVKNIISK
ncbi:hypothetical protein BA918_07885 [Helicobacter pullorum]|nr:hypothetical protein BA918_07885 [Helicobacter pullorum]